MPLPVGPYAPAFVWRLSGDTDMPSISGGVIPGRYMFTVIAVSIFSYLLVELLHVAGHFLGFFAVACALIGRFLVHVAYVFDAAVDAVD